MNNNEDFPDLDEFQFDINSLKVPSKTQLSKNKNSSKKAIIQPEFQSQKIKKQRELKQLNTIQEMNFKYIWNFLKEHQDSSVIKAPDIARAAKGVLKKPIDETLVEEMLSINRQSDCLSEEELRQIFMECKLKM